MGINTVWCRKMNMDVQYPKPAPPERQSADIPIWNISSGIIFLAKEHTKVSVSALEETSLLLNCQFVRLPDKLYRQLQLLKVRYKAPSIHNISLFEWFRTHIRSNPWCRETSSSRKKLLSTRSAKQHVATYFTV